MPIYHKVSNIITLGTLNSYLEPKLNKNLDNIGNQQIPLNNLNNAVKISTNQNITGTKHFQDNIIRLANKYKFEYDPTNNDIHFEYDDLSNQVPVFHFDYQNNLLALDQELSLKANTNLNLTPDKSVRFRVASNVLEFVGKFQQGFKFLEPPTAGSSALTTRFAVEYDSNDSQYHAYIDGTKLATQGYVTSLPVADVFKYALINGGLSSTGLTRNILNPIVIEANQHPITNPDPITFTEDPNTPNIFTINCRGDFNNGINLNDIPVYANAKFNSNNNVSLVPQLSETSTSVLLESTDTFTRQHDSNSSVLPNGVYKVKASQVGSSSQGGHSGFTVVFDLIVGTPGNTAGTPIINISSSSFFTSSHHGIPKITLEVLASSWKVYLTYDHINGSYANDTTTFSLTASLQDL